ncbi:hypothetical protein FE257_004101 [Aspergillus nanangensis]|uniref:Uncharacterized protein n=1 Tax=Aspergillus nanangensis TaxID=2582783 RepID=A0AAD4GP87_ASPNN|nr:hypothetical protein FE257_004101 [Aspergillus nanangensis]
MANLKSRDFQAFTFGNDGTYGEVKNYKPNVSLIWPIGTYLEVARHSRGFTQFNKRYESYTKFELTDENTDVAQKIQMNVEWDISKTRVTVSVFNLPQKTQHEESEDSRAQELKERVDSCETSRKKDIFRCISIFYADLLIAEKELDSLKNDNYLKEVCTTITGNDRQWDIEQQKLQLQKK